MIKYSKFFNVWLLLVGMSLVSACTTEDNAVEPQQEEEVKGFFSDAVNKLIDENYEKVKANGYAELVIPAAMFDHTACDKCRL